MSKQQKRRDGARLLAILALEHVSTLAGDNDAKEEQLFFDCLAVLVSLRYSSREHRAAAVREASRLLSVQISGYSTRSDGEE